MEKAFGELLAHTPPAARVFACGDSAGVRAVARVHDRITTYGFGTSNAVRVRVAEAAEAGSRFSVTGGPDGEVALRVTLPGRHNVLNATAAFLAARQMGPATAPLAAWLEAHGLTYGIAGYWDASIVTLQSGNRVQIRAVDLYPGPNIYAPDWETNALWYNASRHDATFAVADSYGRYPAVYFEHFLGKPAATYRVTSWFVLVYRTNLLRRVLPRPGPH